MRYWIAVFLAAAVAGCEAPSDGAEGEPGVEGEAGPQGPQGQPGLAGLACWDLDASATCDLGLEDVDGDGACSATDCTGPQGLQGIEGPQGPQGIQGVQGSQGGQGNPGQSVTSVALSAGDPDCPNGGTMFVSISGNTFACNGESAPQITGSCAVGQAITAIAADGTLTCGPTAPQRVIRYNVFDTYIEACCWVADNNPSLFGGVNPSDWTDNNGMASQMSPSAETLRTLFNRKLYPGANALVSSERWADQSSTNGKVTVALLRIRNSTVTPINWTPSFYFTSHGNWGERASIALNGADVWSSGTSNSPPNSIASVMMTLPANATSTVIWVSPSSPPWIAGSTYYRMSLLAFYDDSLTLPTGLSLVDDLDTAAGNLW